MSEYTPAAAEVKKLRDETGAGMMDCKRALAESSGDIEAAKDLLRQWGLAGVEKRASRAAAEGTIGYYIHQLDSNLPPRKGSIIELNCETDFVAKTPEFRQLARDIAMHIVAMEPRWVARDDVPGDVMDRERKIVLESDAVKGKPENVVEKIVEGKMNSIFQDRGGVLLEQVFIKDEAGKQTISELITDYAAQVKENIVVRRFARFAIGEDE